MKIRELMTTDVETATLQENLRDVAQKMKDEDAGAIPVVDEDNKIVTTPAYMLAQTIAEAAAGIDKLVARVLVLTE